jgi:DNA-binding transcriptional MerR regulator
VKDLVTFLVDGIYSVEYIRYRTKGRNELSGQTEVSDPVRNQRAKTIEAMEMMSGGPELTYGMPLCERSPSGGGPGGGGTGGSASPGEDGGFLAERDLKTIEREYPDGVTSVQVVDIFRHRQIRFSEATFRKYVQQGLLPRSRRVGRKGKHQGSLGLYPVAVIRRINAIKKLQADNYTIEDIQRQFLRFRDEIEELDRGVGSLLRGFEEELSKPHFDAQARKGLRRDIADARKAADELGRQLASIERRITGPDPRTSSAPGGAEDLL